MKKLYIVVALIFCFGTSFGQTFFDHVTQRTWHGTGTLLGGNARFQMEWDSVLDDSFYKLQFENESDVAQDYVFKAIGYYRMAKDLVIEGVWLDSRGVHFPLHGRVTEKELIMEWGTPETEMGKTVYSIMDDGTIWVKDFIQKEGKMVLFGEAIYQ